MKPKIICLMGPTAAGKTAFACELQQRFPIELISVDSAMVYRGMDIGTAKPSCAELALCPHHLIDIRNPPETFSAKEFCEAVPALSEQILAKGKIPLLVGGTMMYFQALQQGLSSLPAADKELRTALLDRASKVGWETMHAELAHFDPASAARIHANDPQRIQRALEVYYLSGKPLSVLLAQEKASSPYTFINLMLVPEDRAWLHQRIALRFEQMMNQGLLAEVEGLLTQWPDLASSPAMRAVGYRQACDYLQGHCDYQTFYDKGLAATRQLAKRQLTWLRHWPEGQYLYCDEPLVVQKLVAILDKILDNADN